ncbi:MAG: hypothetical protein MRK01_13190 [Candidatus Scalindua sp.]|nr:hypothetical protein [Candidatus Scalindua sp.]
MDKTLDSRFSIPCKLLLPGLEDQIGPSGRRMVAAELILPGGRQYFRRGQE